MTREQAILIAQEAIDNAGPDRNRAATAVVAVLEALGLLKVENQKPRPL